MSPTAAHITSTMPERGLCQLAGCWCRWVRAGWLAGEDVVGVPVLRAAEGVPVSFGLLEAEDVQAVEQRLGLVPGLEGHVRVISPRVTGAEQLAGDEPAGGERPADPRPQGRELLRRTAERRSPAVSEEGHRTGASGKAGCGQKLRFGQSL